MQAAKKGEVVSLKGALSKIRFHDLGEHWVWMGNFVNLKVMSRTPLDVMGQSVKFVWWFVYNNGVSFLGHLDIFTNGIFLGRVLATCQSLPESMTLEQVWTLTMQKSLVPFLSVLPFVGFALLGWLLMLLQWLYALYFAQPLTGKDVQGKNLQYDLIDGDNFQISVHPTRGGDVAHNEALPALLDVTRMASMTGPFLSASLAEYEWTPESKFASPRNCGRALLKSVAKFAVFNFGESVYFLNLQASAVSLIKASDPDHHIDEMTVASISLGLTMACINLVKDWSTIRTLTATIASTDFIASKRETYIEQVGWPEELVDPWLEIVTPGRWDDDHIWAEVQEMQAFQTVQGYFRDPISRDMGMMDSIIMNDNQRYKRLASRINHFFFLVVAIYLLFICRAAVQLYMACECKSGLHNFGVGCVDIPRHSSR